MRWTLVIYIFGIFLSWKCVNYWKRSLTKLYSIYKFYVFACVTILCMLMLQLQFIKFKSHRLKLTKNSVNFTTILNAPLPVMTLYNFSTNKNAFHFNFGRTGSRWNSYAIHGIWIINGMRMICVTNGFVSMYIHICIYHKYCMSFIKNTIKIYHHNIYIPCWCSCLKTYKFMV